MAAKKKNKIALYDLRICVFQEYIFENKIENKVENKVENNITK